MPAMGTTRGCFVIIVLAASAAACASPFGPASAPEYDASVSQDVRAFIEQQALPRVQRVAVLLDVPSQQTQVFRVVYGDSFPVPGLCERGCGYAFPVAVGLRRDFHVGWLSATDSTVRNRFDFNDSDAYLFTEDFFTRLEQTDALLFQQPFKALIAADVDTREEALWLVVRGLSTWISPWIAGILLNNPNVARHCAMLDVVSQLPIFQGDAYESTRERAALMAATCARADRVTMHAS